jgi:hypothetical protein
MVIVENSPSFDIKSPPHDAQDIDANDAEEDNFLLQLASGRQVSQDTIKGKRGFSVLLKRWISKVKTPELDAPRSVAQYSSDRPFYVFAWETSQSASQDLSRAFSAALSKDIQPCVRPELLEAAMATNLLFTSSPLAGAPAASRLGQGQVDEQAGSARLSGAMKELAMMAHQEDANPPSYAITYSTNLDDSPPKIVMASPPKPSPPYKGSPVRMSPQMIDHGSLNQSCSSHVMNLSSLTGVGTPTHPLLNLSLPHMTPPGGMSFYRGLEDSPLISV